MSSTVDNRVVEMRFDNKQFESNVKTSLSTLDRLKKALNFGDSVKGLSQLEKAGKGIDLSKLESGIAGIQGKFSALGVIGITALQNITNAAIDTGKKIASAITEPIISGGISRASNIEKAKFQLEGLKIAWDDIKEDIDYGVKDTAYGLDAAAMAASQLAASQVSLGDDMKTALRGISGVAAMTSSEYTEISRIFTTVAGNGRLMGDQLLQLSSRGLNAASTIAEYLGITEAEVRSMVSDGAISFDIFAKAMDSAFGEHAKDANKTFTGAMSNIKAALARIGADFVTPLISVEDRAKNLVGVLNAIRENINAFKGVIGPVYKVWGELVTMASRFAIQQIKSFDTKGPEKFAKQIEAIWERIKELKLIDDVASILSNSFKALGAVLEPVKEILSNIFPKPTLDQISDFVKDLDKLTDGFIQIRDSSNHVFDEMTVGKKRSKKDLLPPVLNEEVVLFSDSLLKIQNVLKAFFSMLELGKDAAAGLISTFMPLVKILGDDLLTRLDAAATSLISFKESLYDVSSGKLNTSGIQKLADFIAPLLIFKSSEFSLSSILNNVGDALGTIANSAKEVGKAISGAFFENVRIVDFSSVLAKIVIAFKDLVSVFAITGERGDKLKSIFSGIISIFKIFGTILKQVLDALRLTTDEGLTPLGEVATKVFDGILNFGAKVGNFFTDLAKELAKTNSLEDTLKKLVNFISNQVLSVFSFFENTISNISKVLGKASDAVKNFYASFKGDETEKVEKSTTTLEKFATVIGGLVGILSAVAKKIWSAVKVVGETIYEAFANFDMSKAIDVGILIWLGDQIRGLYFKVKKYSKMWDIFTNGLEGVFNVSGILGNVKGVLFQYQQDLKADVLLKIAAAVGILAVALIALGEVDSTKLGQALLAVQILLANMAGLFAALNYMPMTGDGIFGVLTSFINAEKLNLIASTLIKVAASVLILSIAVKSLSDLEWDELERGLVGVAAILLMVVAAAAAFSKMHGSLLKSTTGLIAFALALTIISSVVKKLGDLDVEVLENGILSLAVVMFALVKAMQSFSKMKSSGLGQAASLILMAAAINAIVPAIRKLGELPLPQVAQGVIAMAVALAAMVGALNALGKGSFGGAASLLVLAVAIAALVPSIRSLGELSLPELAKGIIAIGVALMFMVGNLNDLAPGALAGSVALLVLAAAIRLFVPAIEALGSMSLWELIKGLGALALAFTVLGVAAKVLTPLLPSMLGLALALTLIGVAVLAAGVGIIALGTGLGSLGVGLASFGVGLTVGIEGLMVAITAIILGVLELLPVIVAKIGETIIAIVDLIAQLQVHLVTAFAEVGMAIALALQLLVPTLIEVGLELLLALLQGIADNIGKITELAADIIVGFMDALTEKLPELVDSGASLIISFINSMADAVREHGDELLFAIDNLLTSMGELVLSVLQTLVKDIPIVGDELYNMLENAKGNMRAALDSHEMEVYGEKGVERTATGVRNRRGELVGAVKDVKDDAVSQLDGMGDEMAEKTDSAAFEAAHGLYRRKSETDQAAKDIKGGITENLEPMVDETGEIADTTGNNFINILKGFAGSSNDTGSLLKTEFMNGVIDIDPEAVDLANMTGEDANAMLASYGDEFFNTGDLLKDQNIAGYDPVTGEMIAISDEAGSGTTDALESYAGDAYNATDLLKQWAVNGLNGLPDAIDGIGQNSGQGLANGLNAKAGVVAAAAAALANSVAARTQNVLVVQSPSKVMIGIGEYAGEGLAIGLTNMTGMVGDAAEDLGETSVNSLSDAIEGMMQLTSDDIEFSPQITPVLDLSNVRTGVEEIDSLMPNKALDLSMLNSEGFNSRLSLADVSQTGNDRILDEMSLLRGELSTLKDAMTNLQIKMDSGELVGAIAPQMNNELGRMALYTGRGII